MQVDIDRLWQYHEDGKLRHSVHPSRSLHVWCYSQQTVYKREWDDLTRLCRGLVTDNDGQVISRPFPKFHNWGEPEAPGPEITAKPFWAYDKEDGTLIIVGLDEDGSVVVSTKGSFTTWHSEEALRMLSGWKPVPGSTAIFEFIHPGNRIVIDYGDREGLTLLGAVANEDGCDHFTPEQYADESGWFGHMATPRSFNLQAMLQTVQDPENGPNREGFVLVWPNGDGPSSRAKIKFAQYVHLHSVLSRLSNVAVWEALSEGTFSALLEVVPDEMYDKVREAADDLIKRHADVLATANAVFQAADDLPSRREQASYILEQAPVSSIVFKLLDDKPEVASLMAWAEIKPERDTSWSFLK